jgi:hypothetical protein
MRRSPAAIVVHPSARHKRAVARAGSSSSYQPCRGPENTNPASRRGSADPVVAEKVQAGIFASSSLGSRST